MINVTTSYNDTNMDQFMFAIKTLKFDDGPQFLDYSFLLRLSHIKNIYNKTTKQYTNQIKYYNL